MGKNTIQVKTILIKRIAFLYTHISGYLSACLRALKDNYDVEIILYRWPETENAPFGKNLIEFIDYNHIRSGEGSGDIIKYLESLDPQAIYISGWADKGYLKAVKYFKNKGTPIVSGMDAQWRGNLRQRLACMAAKWYLHPAIDILWVPGERQRVFAKKLGLYRKSLLERHVYLRLGKVCERYKKQNN